MNKEFCNYNQSLTLKELGFDEPCLFAFDNCSTPMRCSDLRTNEQKFYGVNYNSSSYTSQPLKSQVFRWFREKHNILSEIQIDKTTEPKYCFSISRYSHFGNYDKIKIIDWFLYRTYEEAEDVCIDKLIEIIKNND